MLILRGAGQSALFCHFDKWLPSERGNVASVAFERTTDRLACLCVPHSNHLIHSGAGQGSTIWCKRDIEHPARVAFACVLGALGIEIPQPDSSVTGAACQLLSVR